jgi:uncharacterized protein YodC (DUF2158 family)
MAEESFKVGDRVEIKSGSPTMTVHSIDEDGDVTCVFFNDKKGKLTRLSVPAATLRIARDPTS